MDSVSKATLRLDKVSVSCEISFTKASIYNHRIHQDERRVFHLFFDSYRDEAHTTMKKWMSVFYFKNNKAISPVSYLLSDNPLDTQPFSWLQDLILGPSHASSFLLL